MLTHDWLLAWLNPSQVWREILFFRQLFSKTQENNFEIFRGQRKSVFSLTPNSPMRLTRVLLVKNIRPSLSCRIFFQPLPERE